MKRKIPEILTEEEILKLFNVCYNPLHRIQLQLMYYCGLRVSEMCALERTDINLKERILKVRQGKGAKDRLIPIPKPLIQSLIIFLEQNPRLKLIDTTPRNAGYIVKRYARKIGRFNIHPHSLRHSYATHLLQKTGNLILIRNLLGHENIQSTQIYTHLTIDDKKTSIDNVWK